MKRELPSQSKVFITKNVVELSEWLSDVALVHDQLTAKRSNEPRGAAKTRKLNHIHQKNPRLML